MVAFIEYSIRVVIGRLEDVPIHVIPFVAGRFLLVYRSLRISKVLSAKAVKTGRNLPGFRAS